jgi:molybdopterin/thiamine biosynthesis adenylyltransferase
MIHSGDRHLRADPAVRLGPVVAGPRDVLVGCDAAVAGIFATQALLSLLVDLLARQFGVVSRIGIAVPEAAALPAAFPGRRPSSSSLADELVALGHRAAGPEIEVVRLDPGVAADIVVWAGPGDPRTIGRLLTVRAIGSGNASWCSTEDAAPRLREESALPFGPHLAACLAADRVFRRFRGMDVSGTFSLDVATFEAPAGGAAQGAEMVRLPAAYLVGLGAVGAAALYTLAAGETVSGAFVGLDPQAVDVPNRNRLLSAGYQDVGRAKSELATSLVDGSRIQIYSNPVRWQDYGGEIDKRTPDELAELERAFRFRWILSCVDRNIGRRDIANVLPQHVLSGSTEGLVAQAAYFSMVGGAECLACNHPIPGVDLDLLRDEFGALDPDLRRARLVEAGASAEERAAVEDYLRDPECGQVGQAVLRRLGVEGPVDWAVGFVSVAAGIMLAAQFVAIAAAGQAPAETERRLFFLGSGSAQASRARRKPDCPLCSDAAARQRYMARWG